MTNSNFMNTSSGSYKVRYLINDFKKLTKIADHNIRVKCQIISYYFIEKDT